jgi:ANTAR domain
MEVRDGFTEMLDWSPEVHQAVGMVSAQMGAPVAEAASRLVRESEDTGRSLDDIARDVIDRRSRFE